MKTILVLHQNWAIFASKPGFFYFYCGKVTKIIW